jgi:hypothetical protein
MDAAKLEAVCKEQLERLEWMVKDKEAACRNAAEGLIRQAAVLGQWPTAQQAAAFVEGELQRLKEYQAEYAELSRRKDAIEHCLRMADSRPPQLV